MHTRRLTSRLIMLAAIPALAALALYGALAPPLAQAHHHSPSGCVVGNYDASVYHLQLLEGGDRADADDIADTNGGWVVHSLDVHPTRPGYVLQFPCPDKDPALRPAAMDALIAAVESDPRVDYLMPSEVSHNEPRHHDAHHDGLRHHDAHHDGLRLHDAHHDGLRHHDAHHDGLRLHGAHHDGLRHHDAHHEGLRHHDAHYVPGVVRES